MIHHKSEENPKNYYSVESITLKRHVKDFAEGQRNSFQLDIVCYREDIDNSRHKFTLNKEDGHGWSKSRACWICRQILEHSSIDINNLNKF